MPFAERPKIKKDRRDWEAWWEREGKQKTREYTAWWYEHTAPEEATMDGGWKCQCGPHEVQRYDLKRGCSPSGRLTCGSRDCPVCEWRPMLCFTHQMHEPCAGCREEDEWKRG